MARTWRGNWCFANHVCSSTLNASRPLPQTVGETSCEEDDEQNFYGAFPTANFFFHTEWMLQYMPAEKNLRIVYENTTEDPFSECWNNHRCLTARSTYIPFIGLLLCVWRRKRNSFDCGERDHWLIIHDHDHPPPLRAQPRAVDKLSVGSYEW